MSSPLFVGANAVIVGRGDTVFALSRRHRVSVRAIIAANGLRPPYHLVVGQRIVLPRTRLHLVRRGETLYAIAQTYGVGLYELARANYLRAPYTIHQGQNLRIPRADATGTARVARAPKAAATSRVAAAAPATRAVAAPPPRSRAGFMWPVKGRIISTFGPQAKGQHNDGINIAAPRGTPVRAADNGVVVYAGNEIEGFGNLVLIKHAGGWVTAYAHNDAVLVKKGQTVRRGEVIAKVGSTGNVTTPQLHFQVRRGRRAKDPRLYLRV